MNLKFKHKKLGRFIMSVFGLRQMAAAIEHKYGKVKRNYVFDVFSCKCQRTNLKTIGIMLPDNLKEVINNGKKSSIRSKSDKR